MEEGVAASSLRHAAAGRGLGVAIVVGVEAAAAGGRGGRARASGLLCAPAPQPAAQPQVLHFSNQAPRQLAGVGFARLPAGCT